MALAGVPIPVTSRVHMRGDSKPCAAPRKTMMEILIFLTKHQERGICERRLIAGNMVAQVSPETKTWAEFPDR